MNMSEKIKVKIGVRHCEVPQCNSYKSASISMHSIPRRILMLPTKLKKWEIALKMRKIFPKNFLICSRHFQTKYLLKAINRTKSIVYLSKSAFPTENFPK